MKNNISAKLTLFIVAASSVITFFAIILFLSDQYKKDVDSLESRFVAIEQVILKPLEKSLWEFDGRQIEIILSGMLTLQDIVSVKVETSNWDGSSHNYHAGVDVDDNSDLYDTRVFEIYKTLDTGEGKSDVLLGSLKVTASLEGVYQRLWNQAKYIIFSQLIKTFLITSVIILLINFLLTRHLNHIADYAKTMRFDKMNDPLVLDRKAGSIEKFDELENVVYAINTIQKNLDVHQKNEAELIREQIKAEIQLKEKSSFISTMSHEIRTPMNGIIGMLDLLSKSDLNEEQAYQLQIAQNSGRMLVKIINEILDLSRLEAGKIVLEKDIFSPLVLVQECVALFSTLLTDDVWIEVIVDSEVPGFICADKLRLTQVLTNLISNAVKFTRKGKICVRLSADELDGENVNIRFEIQDSGLGISAQDQETLFTEFQQIKNFSESSVIGSGLGLSISKRIVELMGGKIGVKSELGAGSNFWFEFVCNRVNKIVEQSDQNSKLEEHLNNEVRYSGRKALVVDDHPTNLSMAGMILKNLGIHFETATNGLEAIEFLKEHHDDIDMVLLDCEMPVMNGYECARLLRLWEDEHNKLPLKVLAVTAHSSSASSKTILESGMNKIVMKPFVTDDLLNALDELYQQGS